MRSTKFALNKSPLVWMILKCYAKRIDPMFESKSQDSFPITTERGNLETNLNLKTSEQ